MSVMPTVQERARGIDVNHYHRIADFVAMQEADLSFVGVKATEANHTVDKNLVYHRDGLRKLPLDLVVYYHFARTGSPVKQAEHLINAVGPLAPNERFALDLEVLPAPPESVLQWVDEFYARLARSYAGMRQLIYTSARIWEAFGNPTWNRDSVDLWAPRYNATGTEPRLPKPWKKWTIWQYTDGGEHGPDYSCPGVGSCDANVWNGDRAAVRAWMAT